MEGNEGGREGVLQGNGKGLGALHPVQAGEGNEVEVTVGGRGFDGTGQGESEDKRRRGRRRGGAGGHCPHGGRRGGYRAGG